MKSVILASLLSLIPLSSFALTLDGQGCMWKGSEGVCAYQIPAEAKSSCKFDVTVTKADNSTVHFVVVPKPEAFGKLQTVNFKSDTPIKNVNTSLDCD